ncbi:putative Vesicle transport through interaction with t-SNAREs-like protein 1A [Hypsibius exemplaris]|uniref:Vesicle transport through interaction with t-SNAREs-like protein 1A n=1 Tax=Hypsibius exemplaris TaxID=2072580 RepID=A0A1W0X137_HYPEX|nr:putative Vesicle transport through interaction with t-SNAREs-like protein 1A [Hypsibius exemplaris]
MASLLQDFEQQYAAITGELTQKLTRLRHQIGADKLSTIREAERCFEECRELFEQMELEVRSFPMEEKLKYQTRLQSYKAQVQTFQRDLKTARLGNSDEANRETLLSMSDDNYTTNDDQQALLQENTDRLDRTTYKMEQAYRAALETEQIGATVLSNLGSQKESLNKTRQRLTEMDEDLGRSSRLLSVMIHRVVQNRVMIVGLMAFLVLIIGICIYLTVHRK